MHGHHNNFSTHLVLQCSADCSCRSVSAMKLPLKPGLAYQIVNQTTKESSKIEFCSYLLLLQIVTFCKLFPQSIFVMKSLHISALVVEEAATIRQLKSTVARTLALKIKRENGPEHISW